jgi:hypothetical protein
VSGDYRYYYAFNPQHRDSHVINMKFKDAQLDCYGHVVSS